MHVFAIVSKYLGLCILGLEQLTTPDLHHDREALPPFVGISALHAHMSYAG